MHGTGGSAVFIRKVVPDASGSFIGEPVNFYTAGASTSRRWDVALRSPRTVAARVTRWRLPRAGARC